eukprot:12412257-Karenia_brevis.AAC.1
MFTAGESGFPILKGRAAFCKRMGPALLHVWDEFMNREDDIHRLVKLGLEQSVGMENLISATAHMNVVPAGEHVKLVEHANAFCAIVTKLGKHFHRDQRTLFNYTIKFHYLLEIVLKSKHLHPCRSHCYGNESFFKDLRKLGGRAAIATKTTQVNNKVADKYLDAIFFELAMSDNVKIFK